MNQEFIKKVLEELYEEHQNTYDCFLLGTL